VKGLTEEPESAGGTVLDFRYDALPGRVVFGAGAARREQRLGQQSAPGRPSRLRELIQAAWAGTGTGPSTCPATDRPPAAHSVTKEP
jgi:hypothetical protein